MRFNVTALSLTVGLISVPGDATVALSSAARAVELPIRRPSAPSRGLLRPSRRCYCRPLFSRPCG